MKVLICHHGIPALLWLLLWPVHFVTAQELATGGKETLSNDSASNASLSSDIGNFARSPFRVSVSVREGYDDNVYTTHENRVDSFFTNGNVVIGYKFGD